MIQINLNPRWPGPRLFPVLSPGSMRSLFLGRCWVNARGMAEEADFRYFVLFSTFSPRRRVIGSHEGVFRRGQYNPNYSEELDDSYGW